jgi:hypothetical protein
MGGDVNRKRVVGEVVKNTGKQDVFESSARGRCESRDARRSRGARAMKGCGANELVSRGEIAST